MKKSSGVVGKPSKIIIFQSDLHEIFETVRTLTTRQNLIVFLRMLKDFSGFPGNSCKVKWFQDRLYAFLEFQRSTF